MVANSVRNVAFPSEHVIEVMENTEPAEFWAALGGKTEYASEKWLADMLPTHPPRLFQCSNASGKFKVEEIFDFSQDVSHIIHNEEGTKEELAQSGNSIIHI